jgi:peptidoglycan/LPS O-acetylase OafA/YrhL
MVQGIVEGRTQQRGTHVPALDGLRGVAILLVMVFHYVATSGFGQDAFVTRKIVSVAMYMFSGVDLFFVLSGFLITGILLRAKEQPGFFRNFYMRRVLRIFPLYYGALVVLFLVVPRFVPIDTPDVKRIYDAQGWLWAYSEDFAISFHNEDFFDVSWLWVGHFWSLAVEEHFYLVWPLVVFVCSPRALLWTCLGLLVSAPLIRGAMLLGHMDPAAVYTFTLSRTDELAMGGLLALVARERSFESLARAARFAALAAAGYFVIVAAVHRKPLWWGNWTSVGPGFSFFALGAAALIVLAQQPGNGPLRRVLEGRALRTLGKYSYGAYVIHTSMEPIFLRLVPPARLADLARGLGHSGSQLVGLLGFGTVGICGTLLLAVASYHAYEKPFLSLKRYFEYDAARPADVPQAVEPPSPEEKGPRAA